METCISQQPKAIESSNWYQTIAMTIFYNHVIRYINKLTFLLLHYLRKLKDIREKSLANEGGIPIKLLISQCPNAPEG